MKQKKPFKEALEALFSEYQILDWAIAVRGDLDKILQRDEKTPKIAYWMFGSGEKHEKLKDHLRAEFLLIDLRKMQRDIENYLTLP